MSKKGLKATFRRTAIVEVDIGAVSLENIDRQAHRVKLVREKLIEEIKRDPIREEDIYFEEVTIPVIDIDHEQKD